MPASHAEEEQTVRELQTLVELLGCPLYGSKETLVIRHLAHRKLRFKPARFRDSLYELASSYRRESLRGLQRV
jgi:hypothetical protein